jgi:hypothetical protein
VTHIPGSDRSQLLLLPEAIDDCVAADNPVRFIDAFADGLDLKATGFARVEAKATGRPGYAPGELDSSHALFEFCAPHYFPSAAAFVLPHW